MVCRAESNYCHRTTGNRDIRSTHRAQDDRGTFTAAGRKHVWLHGGDRCRCMDADSCVAQRPDTGFVAADDVPPMKYQLTFDVQRQRPCVQQSTRECHTAPIALPQPLHGNRRGKCFLKELAMQLLWSECPVWRLTLFEVAGGARSGPGELKRNEVGDFSRPSGKVRGQLVDGPSGTPRGCTRIGREHGLHERDERPLRGGVRKPQQPGAAGNVSKHASETGANARPPKNGGQDSVHRCHKIMLRCPHAGAFATSKWLPSVRGPVPERILLPKSARRHDR